MSYISSEIRQLVINRAASQCEYCQTPQAVAFFAFEMEHIIAEKHGGETVLENLALACPYCNRAKGSDLGSIDPISGVLTPFFHPRQQIWEEHFCFVGREIVPLTAHGRVTVKILQLNHPERLAQRLWLETA
jgi:hypothetical protein